MADIKTHLRELSVAITIGLLNAGIDCKPSDLYSSRNQFLSYARKVISNDISSAENLAAYETFSGELKTIIENGYKLGKKIYNTPYFNFTENNKILWLGNDTQKGDPIDIAVGDYGFSLKEESFILQNMGLYQLLNNLTCSSYSRGLHVFNMFAPNEYNLWFTYTWKSFCEYLQKNQQWRLTTKNNHATAFISNQNVIMDYNKTISVIPMSITTNKEFINHTSAKTREKIFAKWIKNHFANNPQYISLKKACSEVAGQKVCQKITTEFKPDNTYRFFQIYLKEYYYAKTTANETTILKVPSRKDFNSIIEFKGCRYEVPGSQLNIITTFQNIETGRTLEFRNECRFSHGQFNGTPEAKLYITQDTPLTELYIPL